MTSRHQLRPPPGFAATPRRGRGSALAAAGLAAALVLGPGAAGAFAAADASATASSSSSSGESTTGEASDQVRWAVAPSDASGPDGRRVINLDLEPGATITDHVAVRNLGSESVTFALAANDGYLTASGSFDMMPSDHVPVDGGAWVDVLAEVTVGPGESAIVPFTVTVPDDATPGDHPAGVAASIRSGGESMVGTEHRVGVRVNLRVAGEVLAQAELSGAAASVEPAWNPFEPGSVAVDVDVANTGNVRISGDLVVQTSGWLGSSVVTIPADDDAAVGELIPGGSRSASTLVDDFWALGPVTTTVTFTPVVLGESGGAGQDAVAFPVTTSVTTWAIPWPQLLLLLVVGGVVAAVRSERGRRRRALEAKLAQARAEGARAAAGATSGD